ncbi:MAG: rRNA maturation RNase YbeY [Clostridia bacterium]|nr:rRNA maturation RNase YbeY [Clostridia bacterium]
MAKVKVIISDRQKAVEIPTGLRLLVRKVCTAALKEQGFLQDAEVNVTFVDDAQIHQYNLEFRNIDRSTDVLSFPMGEDGQWDINPETNMAMLGDIVISLEHAVAQAKEFDHSFEREVGYLTVHSMMHLLGYDHVNGGLQADEMRYHEEQVMEMLALRR